MDAGHIAMRDMIETMTPILDSSARGETLWLNNLQFTFERAGHMTETYFTFSYSPLRNEDGDITGFIAPVRPMPKGITHLFLCVLFRW